MSLSASAARYRAIALMTLCCLMWSSAAWVTLRITQAQGLEITAWRSLFAAVALVVFFLFSQGLGFTKTVAQSGWVLWASGALWASQFTCFMLAITLTDKSNALIVSSATPLFAALIAWLFLKKRVPNITWLAIAIGAAGMSYMLDKGFVVRGTKDLIGIALAFFVPIGGALNMTLIQWQAARGGAKLDMRLGIMLGGAISALVTLPFVLAGGAQANVADLSWLAFLGVFQLAIPCVILISVLKVLPAHQVALLALMEPLFAVTWVWLAGAPLAAATVIGGLVVLGALVLNEVAQPRA